MTLLGTEAGNTPSTIVAVTKAVKPPLQRTRHGRSAGVAYELRVAAAVPTVGTRRHRASQNIPAPRSSSVFASGCVRIQSACPTGLPLLSNCNYPKFQCTAQPTPKADIIMQLMLGVCPGSCPIFTPVNKKKWSWGRPTELVTDIFTYVKQNSADRLTNK